MPGTVQRVVDNVGKANRWLHSSRDVRFYLHRVLWDVGFPWTRLRPTPLTAIFPDIDRVNDSLEVVHPFERTRGTSLELEELIVVLSIARFRGVRRALEIGTFDGNTALNLAVNLAADGQVVTIDLPPEGDAGAINAHPDSMYADGRPAAFARRQYENHPAAERIRQIYGDSARLDWSALNASFDLAFIDGDHSAGYVAEDTRNVLSVLRPGGVVLWHDYEWRSVAEVIDAAVGRGQPIHWIAGTRLAVATFDDPVGARHRFRS